MLTQQDKDRIKELDKQIEKLLKEKERINPYSILKILSNKQFGEEWSENLIIEKCSTLSRVDKKGYDLYSKKLGKIEVKSSRCPLHKTTWNQLHPEDCDYFLFVQYDIENYAENLFLIPSKDILEKFKLSAQHDRNSMTCFSMGSTRFNLNEIKKYAISWEQLKDIT